MLLKSIYCWNWMWLQFAAAMLYTLRLLYHSFGLLGAKSIFVLGWLANGGGDFFGRPGFQAPTASWAAFLAFFCLCLLRDMLYSLKCLPECPVVTLCLHHEGIPCQQQKDNTVKTQLVLRNVSFNILLVIQSSLLLNGAPKWVWRKFRLLILNRAYTKHLPQ